MRHFRVWFASLVAIVLLLPPVAAALAATPADNADLLRIVRALESRIDALERQVQTLRAEPKLVEAALTADAPARRYKPQSASPAAANAESYRIASLGASHDASGAYETPAAQAAARPWDGWYWGGSVVAGITQASLDLSARTSSSNGFRSSHSSQTDSTVGGGGGLEFFGGINRRLGNSFVAGIEVGGAITDLDFSSEGSSNLVAGFPGEPKSYQQQEFDPRVHARWMVAAVGRLGWMPDEATMLYGLAGYTLSRFDVELGDQFSAYPVDDKDNDFFGHGLTIGIGGERKFAGPWSLRAEYRFTHFISDDVRNINFEQDRYDTDFSSTSANSVAEFENQLHSLRFGVAYHLPPN